MISYT